MQKYMVKSAHFCIKWIANPPISPTAYTTMGRPSEKYLTDCSSNAMPFSYR